jgi:Tol biopolymer transport system component
MIRFTVFRSRWYGGGSVRRKGDLLMKLRCCRDLLLLVMLSTALSAESVDAGVIKLNGALPTGARVQRDGIQFSPDGSQILYVADQETFGVYELYSVSSDGGTPVKLNEQLVTGGDVYDDGVQFSPDGLSILYRADQETNGVAEIYGVPGDGGTAVKLNGQLANDYVDDRGLQFSPDSSRVLFRATQDTAGVWEIYSVPSDGGTAVKLNGQLVDGGDVYGEGLQFIPDGSRVVYRADQEVDGVPEIYSVLSNGGTPTRLNGELTAGGRVQEKGIRVSLDSSRVLYIADQEIKDIYGLYSVPSGGGTSVKLNEEQVGIEEVFIQFSPDSSRVLYLGYQEAEESYGIYTVPSQGGTSVKVDTEPVAADDIFDGSEDTGLSRSLQFSSDSSRILYLSYNDNDDVYGLYVVPSEGGTAVHLTGELVAGRNIEPESIQFSPDDSQILYLADQDTNGVYELYVVPSEGGTSVKLNGQLVTGGDVERDGPQFSPDGSRVLYVADQDTNGVYELYIVPSEGGTPVKLNGQLVTGGDVEAESIQFSPDSSRVLYRADQDTNGVYELYTRKLFQEWNVASGQWDEPGNWDQGELPGDVWPIEVNPESFATVTGPASDTSIFSLDIGATATGVATLDLQPSVTLTVANQVAITDRGALTGSGHLDARGGLVNDGRMDLDGMTAAGLTLQNNGVISGSGTIDNALANSASGEIRVGPGQRLHMTGIGAQANAGDIEVIGIATQFAEIEFDGALTNAASTGNITARHAIMRFKGGLANQGAVKISFGTSDVHGDIDNQSGATITVKGNSNVTFWDDLTNNGTVEVTSGSTTAHFGILSGEGSFTGGGTNFVEGGLSPGSSPGTISFDGELVLGSVATTLMELAGANPGEYDQIIVGGELSLDGQLMVQLIDGYVPSDGDSFDIFDFGLLAGDFQQYDLPPLPDDLLWNITGLAAEGILAIETAVTTLAGDFNNDGTVDAADYTLWRDGDSPDSTTADYALWKNHFGQSAASGSGADHIPEPTTLLLALLALAAAPLRVRHG